MVLPQFCERPMQPSLTRTLARELDALDIVVKSAVPGPSFKKSINPEDETAAVADILTFASFTTITESHPVLCVSAGDRATICPLPPEVPTFTALVTSRPVLADPRTFTTASSPSFGPSSSVAAVRVRPDGILSVPLTVTVSYVALAGKFSVSPRATVRFSAKVRAPRESNTTTREIVRYFLLFMVLCLTPLSAHMYKPYPSHFVIILPNHPANGYMK